jgi:hypothetical protein
MGKRYELQHDQGGSGQLILMLRGAVIWAKDAQVVFHESGQ